MNEARRLAKSEPKKEEFATVSISPTHWHIRILSSNDQNNLTTDFTIEQNSDTERVPI